MVKKVIAKSITIAIIIFTMLFSNFAPIISWAIENVGKSNEEAIADKIKFEISWENNEQIKNCIAGEKYNINYTISFSGVQSGFKNMKISVLDNLAPKAKINVCENYSNYVDASSSTSDTLAFNPTINSGIQASGSMSITYPRAADYADYQKEITVVVTGEYKDQNSGDTIYVYITKTIKANVSTPDLVDAFTSNIVLGDSNPISKRKLTSVGMVAGEYTVSNVYVNAPFEVRGHNVAYAEYKLKLKRTSNALSDAQLNSEENLNITVSNLPSYMKKSVVRNADGTTDVIISVGEQKEQYTSEDLFDFNNVVRITADYIIKEDTGRNGTTSSTLVTLEYSGNVKGFDVRKNREGTSYDEKTDSYSKMYSEFVGLNYFIGDYMAVTNITADSCLKEDFKTRFAEGKIDIDYSSNATYWDRRPTEQKQKLRINGYREGESAYVTYQNEDKSYSRANLTNNELTLKKITVQDIGVNVAYAEFYKKGETEPFFRADSRNSTYTVPEGETITDYYVIFDYMYGTTSNAYPRWISTYTLHKNRLSQILSETQIENIRSITRYQEGYFGDTDVSNAYYASYEITVPSNAEKHSYFELALENMNTNANQYGVYNDGKITLKFKGEKNFNDERNVQNTNPKFFVKLPDIFDYDDIKVTLSQNQNSNIQISNKNCPDEGAWYITGDNYLVINCAGVWEYSNGVQNIDIQFKKKINTYNLREDNTIQAFMITNEGKYRYNRLEMNRYDFSMNGVTPTMVPVSEATFTIGLDNSVSIRNAIVNGEREYYPSSTIGSKEKPVKAEEGSTVKYKTELSSNGKAISNINIISRLPKAGNSSISGTTRDLESTISLNNLKNIQVKFFNGGMETDMPTEKYTILYSSDINANFGSTFTPYTEGDTNISNAKTIQVLFDPEYTISSNYSIRVYFEMKMPAAEGISAQISAVKYKSKQDNNITELEPAAVYVEKGSKKGTLILQKEFVGFEEAVAGSTELQNTENKENIEFKIKNIKTNEFLVINGQTNSEGIIKTNSQGRFTLTEIPEGKYEVIEITTFEKYKPEGPVYFEIENGNTVERTFRNVPKMDTLTIKKEWENTNTQQDTATFKVTRIGDLITYEKTVTTDITTGTAGVELPYGKYSITELNTKKGWKCEDKTIDFLPTNKVVTMTNTLKKTSLTIVKTVPNVFFSSDLVLGISFRIQGKAFAESYIDENGEVQSLDYDKTIVVDGSTRDGVTQQITDSGKKVTITINDLYVGNYTITEVDMPKIEVDGEQVNKYADLIVITSLIEDPVTVKIDNVWKKGRIEINKTADEGVELKQFKFRVQGTSAYGTTVNQIIDIDENGKGSAMILLGEYTIEEVETDAYTASYDVKVNGVSTKSNNSATIKIKDDSTITIDVENTLDYGYVKINKTFDDTTDVSKASGIKFIISGVAPTGANINTEIIIGDDGIGISDPIPAGGDYEIYEDESTVPEGYEVMDPTEIEITKNHTSEHPLEFNVENERGRGTLDISTETNPAGGDVYPIVYKAQEIVIDNEGNYTRIENTQKMVDGDLLGNATLLDLPAGSYIVEQTSVPIGWNKDTPKIVDVPVDGKAKALFVIDKQEDFDNTRVIISKSVYNPNQTIASDEDYAKYKVKKGDTFEVRLINTATGKEYYTFMSTEKDGIIAGLPQGRYELEEVYKPRYKVKSYGIVNEETVTELEAVDGKYYIEIGAEEEGKNEVKVHIDNIIDNKFGFGGQDSKENLSTLKVEAIKDVVTRADLYIVDEEGNKIEGCTFGIFDSNNRKVIEISPKNKQVIIKGLEPGTYTVKNTKVPNGYLLADDCYITVYRDVVRIKRIEIQKNVPRCSLELKTEYIDNGRAKNVPKSKYQIVNSDTGELITFQKTIGGKYKKSNLADAVDTISVRAGTVTIIGLEEGNYEVGIVDITSGFAIEHEDVEDITLSSAQEQPQKLTINATKMYIVDMASTDGGQYLLDNVGNLYAWGNSGIEPALIATNVEKISAGKYSKAILYKDGTIATFGSDSYGNLGQGSVNYVTTPTTLDFDSKVADISTGSNSTLIMDVDGNLWYAGRYSYMGLGRDLNNNYSSERDVKTPICLTSIPGGPFENISVEKVYAGLNINAVIDSLGRLWTWSNGSKDILGCYVSSYEEAYRATCVSLVPGNDIYEAYKKGIKIVDVSECCAIDEEGNLYGFCSYYGYTNNATSLTKAGAKYEGKKFIKAVGNKVTTGNGMYCYIDEDGNMYYGSVETAKVNGKYQNTKFAGVTLGYNTLIAFDENSKMYGLSFNDYDNNYELGLSDVAIDLYRYYSGINLAEIQMSLPNYSSHFIHDIKFKKVVTSQYISVALDCEGNLWSWGYNNGGYNNTGNGGDYVKTPRIIEFNEDIKFKDVEIGMDESGYHSVVALDTKGRVWTWGRSDYNMTGGGGANNQKNMAKICLSEVKYLDLGLNTAYQQGITIEEIKVEKGIVFAKDNRNKIWAWGNLSGSLGSNVTKATCISEAGKIKEIYDEGLTIEKYSWFNGFLASIDNEGSLWFLMKDNKFKLTDFAEEDTALLSKQVAETGLKIVDVQSRDLYSSSTEYCLVIDELGRVWKISKDFKTQECLTTKENSNLASEYANNNKIKRLIHRYSTPLGIDSKGHIWDIINDTCVASNTEYIYVTSYDNTYLALDKDEHMWVWGNNNYYQLGTGKNDTISEPTLTTSSAQNQIYGIKFNGYKNGYFESQDGEMYSISNLLEANKYNQTDTYLINQGISLKQYKYDHYGAAYAIDNDGKLYLQSDRKWYCASDKEGTAIYNEYHNNNVRMEEITYLGGQYLFRDSNNKLWRADGKPVIDTDKEGTAIYDEFHNNNVAIEEIMYLSGSYFLRDSNNKLWREDGSLAIDTEFKKVVNSTGKNTIIEDINGDYWICGNNNNGLLGTGNLDSYDGFVKIDLGENTKPGRLVHMDDRCIYLIDNKDKVWAWGRNENWNLLAGYDVGIVVLPYCWNLEVSELYVRGYKFNNDIAYAVFAIDKEGCVWSAGTGSSRNVSTTPGVIKPKSDTTNGLQGKESHQLGKIDNSELMGKIVKLVISSDTCYAINEDGDLWTWGCNSYGAMGIETSMSLVCTKKGVSYYDFGYFKYPQCLTNMAGNFYHKKVDVVNLCGYYENSEYNKTFEYAGKAEVLVTTEDGSVYKMGDKSKRRGNSDDPASAYKISSARFPAPKSVTINGNITEVSYKSGMDVYLKTDEGNIYKSYSNSNFEELTDEKYENMTLDEIIEADKVPQEIGERIEIDKQNHKITNYKRNDPTQEWTVYNEYEYPSTIDVVDGYVSRYAGYIIDSNGDLWMIGLDLEVAPNDEWVCVTKLRNKNNPIWNTTRGRWQLIRRKY